MRIEAKVGPQVNADGAETELRLHKDASLIVAQSHGRYSEAVGRGNVFTASNQTGAALTAFATSASTGFILHNPVNSGKRLSLLEILFQQTSAAAAAQAVVSLAAGVSPIATQPSGLTSLVVRNAQLGTSGAGAGLAYGAATVGTADVIVRALNSPSVSATATTAIPPLLKDEVSGALEIMPGCWVKMTSTTALSGITTMTWEELPI